MTGSRARRAYRERALERYRRHRRVNCLATPGPHQLVVVLDHLKANFNVAKIFRSAQAFGVQEVHLIGIGEFDPAPAKGAFRAVPACFLDDFSESHALLCGRGYRLFALAPGRGEVLTRCHLPLRSAFVLGHEEFGLGFDPDAYPGVQWVHIPQVGPVQSLNVSIAASLAMYEYWRQRIEAV